MATHRIDIDQLNEAELIDLNRRVVERLKMMHALRSHRQMLQFSVGDRVRFDPPGHGVVTGILTRYNRKTVTVLANDGMQWNVAPALLRVADPPMAEAVGPRRADEPAVVIELPQRKDST